MYGVCTTGLLVIYYGRQNWEECCSADQKMLAGYTAEQMSLVYTHLGSCIAKCHLDFITLISFNCRDLDFRKNYAN